MHKRSKLTINDIIDLQNNLTGFNYPVNSHFESNPLTFFIPRPPNTFIGIPPIPMNGIPPVPPMPMSNLVNNNERNRNNSLAFQRPNSRRFEISRDNIIIN